MPKSKPGGGSLHGEWSFVSAAGSVESLPRAGEVEVAFAGRSNVGKSSLINALTGRKALARAPRTRLAAPNS
jgi:GTP-binding protein